MTETQKRRAVLGIILATLTATAYFFAQGSTQLLASAFLDVAHAEAEPTTSRARVAAASSRPTREELGRAMLDRNVFDRGTGSVSWDPPVVAVAEADEVDGPAEPVIAPPGPDEMPPRCEGSIRLVASWLRTREPDQSFAAITNAAGVALLYLVGMRVDDREITDIRRDAVILHPAGAPYCSISMFGAQPSVATPRPAPPAAVVAAAEPAEGGVEQSELDSNIQQISETSYAVNRTLVDRLLSNQAELMRTARVIPHEVDGRVVGVKIYGIRRSSVLGRLGIQNGDMLRSLNGYDLTEPDRVLEAYTRLRSADRLSLSIERRGAPVAMDYQIR